MQVQDIFLQIRELLQNAGVPDAGFDAEALIRHVAGAPRLFVDGISPQQEAELLALARRRAKREPLQYILGSWAFLDLELAVGPGVLAPRPETEEVCLAAADLLAGRWRGKNRGGFGKPGNEGNPASVEKQEKLEPPAILDLCSGSGALALGLQSIYPGAHITAVEKSPQAFAYLRQNIAAFLQAHSRAPRAVLADVFSYDEELAPHSLDLIVCNPPYVTAAEYENLAPEVLAEPREALVPADDAGCADGLSFYRVVAEQYKRTLAPGGAVVFEIGAGQGAALRDILQQNGYGGIEIRKDLAGHDRIALAEADML